MSEESEKPPRNLGNAGKGRPPGKPNKTSRDAKENIIAVFTRLGGTAAMARWARHPANRTDFYKLYCKLLPLTLAGDADNPIRLQQEDINKMTDEQLTALAGRMTNKTSNSG